MAEILIHPTLAERLDDALQLAADVGGALVISGSFLTLVQYPPGMAERIESARQAARREMGSAPCAA